MAHPPFNGEADAAIAKVGVEMELSRVSHGLLSSEWRNTTGRSKRIHLSVFAVMAGLFILAQIFLGLGVNVIRTSDTPVFLGMANAHSVFSAHFLAGPRPPLVPLVIKLLFGSERLFVAFQWIVHIVAWGALAWYYFEHSAYGVRGLALAMWVFVLALLPQVHIWNFYIMSESLSISCLPLVFALLPRCLSYPGVFASLPLGIVLVGVCMLRDIGAYLAVSLGLALLAVDVATKSRRMSSCLLLGAVIFGLGYSSITANIGTPTAADKRWVFPFLNVVGQRVLPCPDRLSDFAERGMPVNDALRARTGKWASSDGFAFYNDPQLASFLVWATTQGGSTYTSWLLAHPSYLIKEVLSSRREILHQTPGELSAYLPGGYPALPADMSLLDVNLRWVALPFAVAVPYALWRRRRGPHFGDGNRLRLAFASLVPIPVLMIVTYHGDAMDVARHSVLVSVYVRLYLLFLAHLLIGGNPVSEAKTPRSKTAAPVGSLPRQQRTGGRGRPSPVEVEASGGLGSVSRAGGRRSGRSKSGAWPSLSPTTCFRYWTTVPAGAVWGRSAGRAPVP